jgi:glucose-1-phosphate thymidylyltransferase
LEGVVSILLFEDGAARRLHPVTLTRPAYTISCGANRLVDLLAGLGRPLATFVRPYLAALATGGNDLAAWRSKAVGAKSPVLLVNARLVPSAAALGELTRLVESGAIGIVRSGDAIAAALLPPDKLPAADIDWDDFQTHLAQMSLDALDANLPLIDYPHDIIRHHLATLADNLGARIAEGKYHEVAAGVFAAEKIQLGPHVAVDTSGGPIVLEKGVAIGPFTYLEGPVHVGAAARISEHSAIKTCTALGKTTKVGGEVCGSIIEPFSNKQHYGFLGYSYVGSWVNLGAGTCNSNLKNTYGEITVRYDREKVATGMQFLGMIVGDYAKTAIHSTIYTGKTIGVASFIYGTVPENVPSFVNYARDFGQVTTVSVEAAATTQARMFARRGSQQKPADVALLTRVFKLTEEERSGMATDVGPPRFG